jgi:MFS family permease
VIPRVSSGGVRPRFAILPLGAASEARVLLAARGLRAVGDGLVSLLLPVYLLELGYGPFETGVIATATLAGSALLTLLLGLYAHRSSGRNLLIGAALLMVLTGIAFAALEDFWPLLLVAFIGTLNPSSGDVSIFLPLEQAQLARWVSDRDRTLRNSEAISSTISATVAGPLCSGALRRRSTIDRQAALIAWSSSGARSSYDPRSSPWHRG